MARKGWDQLSLTTQARYRGAGISREQYESGASLRAARGHASTPDRPEQGLAGLREGRYRKWAEGKPFRYHTEDPPPLESFGNGGRGWSVVRGVSADEASDFYRSVRNEEYIRIYARPDGKFDVYLRRERNRRSRRAA